MGDDEQDSGSASSGAWQDTLGQANILQRHATLPGSVSFHRMPIPLDPSVQMPEPDSNAETSWLMSFQQDSHLEEQYLPFSDDNTFANFMYAKNSRWDKSFLSTLVKIKSSS